MTQPLQYRETEASEVRRVATNIANVVVEESIDTIHVACLSLALGVMAVKPLTPKQLHEGVKGCSEWMSMFLDSVQTPAGPAN